MVVRNLGKFNYVKYNNSMPMDKKIEYIQSYMNGRKLFSQYYMDNCTNEQNKFKQKLINRILGAVVEIDEYGKCVPVEIIWVKDKLRIKFFYLDQDKNIELLTLFYTKKEANEFQAIDYDLEFLFN